MVPAPQAALFVAEIVAKSRQSRQIVAESRQNRQIVAESCCDQKVCGWGRPDVGFNMWLSTGRMTGNQLAWRPESQLEQSWGEVAKWMAEARPEFGKIIKIKFI